MKWVLSMIFFLALATSASAQEFNAGFVQGLWYGDEGVFAEKPTRVYVAIRNNTGADLTGTVEFFDNGTRIERNNVSALDGRIIESWSDWTPSYGEHTVTATLSRIELHQVGSGTEAVEVVSALAESIIFVDYDTDGDGVVNENDPDDDGDGVSDIQEEENGTDPLDATDPPPEPEETTANSEEDKSDVNNSGDDGISSVSSAEKTISSNGNSNGPEGLEQFLNESRVDSALTSITSTVNNTKKRIDDYRNTRNSSDDKKEAVPEEEINSSSGTSTASTTTSSTSTATSIDGGGFGEITRTQEKSGKKFGGFLSTVTSLAKTLVGAIYTLSLFLLSLYLTNPIIVQLTLLLLILFLLYKVARRLGNRQNY